MKKYTLETILIYGAWLLSLIAVVTLITFIFILGFEYIKDGFETAITMDTTSYEEII